MTGKLPPVKLPPEKIAPKQIPTWVRVWIRVRYRAIFWGKIFREPR